MWLNLVIFVVMAAIVIIQANRSAVCTVAEMLIMLGLSQVLPGMAKGISHHVHILKNPYTNAAFWVFFLLVVIGVGVVFLTKFLEGFAALHLEGWDTMIGVISGLITAGAVGRIMIEGFLSAYPETSAAYQALDGTFFAQELIHFRTWHHFIRAATHMGEYD